MDYVYPFICRWACGLSPFLSCSDQNGCKHECANISVDVVSYLFMYLFTYLFDPFFFSVYIHSYAMLRAVILWDLLLSLLKSSSISLTSSLSQCPCPYDLLPWVNGVHGLSVERMHNLPASWHSLILYMYYCNPRIKPSTRESWLLQWRMVLDTYILNARWPWWPCWYYCNELPYW